MSRILSTVMAWPLVVALQCVLGTPLLAEDKKSESGPPKPGSSEKKPEPEVLPSDLKSVVEGNNAFAIELYKKIAEKETGNIMFSPYSISSALSMTIVGARGKTAEELLTTLSLIELKNRTHPAFHAVSRQLLSVSAKADSELNIANSLWGQKGLGFKSDFLEVTKQYYAGGFNEVDFSGDPNSARLTINRWVEGKTSNKIKELIGLDDINTSTKRLSEKWSCAKS